MNEHLERILDIFNRYEKKQMNLEELQGWIGTLLLEEFVSEKQKHQFEERLEEIRFCVIKEEQYKKVMDELNLMKKILKEIIIED